MFKKSEEKIQKEAEDRERNFVNQRDIFMAATQEDNRFNIPPEEKNDLVRWQQDLSPELEAIKHALRREILIDGEWKPQQIMVGIDNKGRTMVQDAPAMMNELGIHFFMAQVSPMIDRNLMMSNYDEDRILMKLHRNVSTFVIALRHNFYFFEMRKGDLSGVVQLYKSIVEPTHWRCWNNGERRHLTSIHKYIEARNESQNPNPKKGLLGGVFN